MRGIIKDNAAFHKKKLLHTVVKILADSRTERKLRWQSAWWVRKRTDSMILNITFHGNPFRMYSPEQIYQFSTAVFSGMSPYWIYLGRFKAEYCKENPALQLCFGDAWCDFTRLVAIQAVGKITSFANTKLESTKNARRIFDYFSILCIMLECLRKLCSEVHEVILT